MTVTSVGQRIVDWLRAGYPEGVPQRDYVPIFALLTRHLSDQEVADTAERIQASQPGQHASVIEAILAMHRTPPSDADIARVEARLHSVGFELPS